MAAAWRVSFRLMGTLFAVAWSFALQGQVEQILTWATPNSGVPLVLGIPQALNATASSGLPVTFRLDRGPAVIEDGMIRATNLGTIQVTAVQAGNADFLPASQSRTWNQPEIQVSVVTNLDVAGKVRIHGNLLLVAGPTLALFGIQNPSHPVALGALDLGEPVRDVAPMNGHALLATGNRLGIVDIAQPAQPELVGSVDLGSSALTVAVEGTLACVAKGTDTFNLVDWSNPRAPRLLTSVTPVSGLPVTDVAIRNGLVYVSGPNLPVAAFDVRPTVPVPWGPSPFLWNQDCRLTTDDRSLFAAGAYDLGVLKLSREHESPGSLAFTSFSLYALDVRVLGDRVYIASNSGGARVVDVEDRDHPRLLEQAVSTTLVQSIDALPGYVVTGVPWGPVQILKTREGLVQTLTSHVLPQEVWVTNGPLTLDLIASGSSGSPPVFRLLEGPAVLSGNQVTLTNAGLVYGEIIVPGNEQFLELRTTWSVIALKFQQSILFRPPAVVGLARGSLPLQGSASSGLPVSYEVISGPATLEGQTLTLGGVGTVLIRATQPGDLAFRPAEPVLREIQIQDLPEISRQPEPTNVASGSPVVLEVAATATTTPRFEWYKDGSLLPLETSPTLRRSAASLDDQGLYHVVLRNEAGGAVTSSVVSLTLDLPGSEVALRPRGSLRHRATPGLSNPGRLVVQGNYAYVVNQGLPALQIMDIRDPDFPNLVATVKFLSNLHQDLAYKDGYLLLAEREQGIGIIDVRNPEKPVRLTSYRFPLPQGFPANRSDAVTLQVVGNQAWVGNGSLGVALLDVQDPTRPVLLSSLDTSGLAAGIWLSGDHAYVADWSSGLKVLNISKPASPRLVGRYPNQDTFLNYYDLLGRDGAVYLTHEDVGLLTLDISRPQAPWVSQTNRGSIFGLDLSGPTLFAADNGTSRPPATRKPGVRLFDVSRPLAPVEFGRFALWGGVDGTLLQENRLFVTGDRFGIIDVEYPQRPPSFVREPRSQVLRSGEPGFLEALAEGTGPLSYQWWYRGLPLIDATNRVLSLGPVTSANAGQYVVEVRNPWGIRRSAPARVGFEQRVRWDLLETNSVLRIQRPHALSAVSDQGLPVSYRILSGPATVANGELWITNVGTVRIVAEQTGTEAYFPDSREWTLNVGEVRFTEIGRWPEFRPGAAEAVAIEGDTAILAIREGGLLALDIADPERPRYLGRYWSPGVWTDVHLEGGVAYAVNSGEGLHVVDFHDPAHPVLISTVSAGLFEGRLNLANKIAYLHDQIGQFLVVDVSNPASPVQLPAPAILGVNDLVVAGNRMFATGSDTLVRIVDVSDPKNLIMVGSTIVFGRGTAIAVRDNLIAVQSEGGGLDLFRWVSERVLDPIARLDLPIGSGHLEWWGSVLCVASAVEGLVLVETAIPEQPRVIATTGSEVLSRARSFQIHRDHAFFTDANRGLVTYDLRSGTPPREVSSFPTTAVAGLVRVDGGRAYLSGTSRGLTILDVSDPGHPRHLGGIPARNEQLNLTRNLLAIRGARAFLSDGSPGIQIVDVEDPRAPTRLGVILTPEATATAIEAVSGTELHVADSAQGIRTYDVTDAANPVLLGNSPFSDVSLFRISGHRRISAGTRNVYVEDLASPGSSVLLGRAPLNPGDVTSMEVAGDRVFVASARPASVIVVDVAVPQNPVELSRIPQQGRTTALNLQGEYLLAAQGPARLAAYHAFLPGGLQLAGEDRSFSYLRDIHAVDDLVYATDDLIGLRILQWRSGIPQNLLKFLPEPPLESGISIDLPAESDAGRPVRYTVVQGDARVEGGVLRIGGEGEIRFRAEADGDIQYLPATAEVTLRVRTPPVLTIDVVEAGLRVRWAGSPGLLMISDSLQGPWAFADILSSEYSEAEQTTSVTLPVRMDVSYYRVLRP
jgi:hypothetical protein